MSHGSATTFFARLAACAAIGLCAAPALAAAGPPPDYAPMIARYARQHGVPERLIHRVIMRESRYNPRVVAHGNYGLMQIRLGTARGMGYTGSAQGLLDADTNMRHAVAYLANAYITARGNEDLAVRYYAGGYYYAAKRQGLLGRMRTAHSGGAARGAVASFEPTRVETAAPAETSAREKSVKPAEAAADEVKVVATQVAYAPAALAATAPAAVAAAAAVAEEATPLPPRVERRAAESAPKGGKSRVDASKSDGATKLDGRARAERAARRPARVAMTRAADVAPTPEPRPQAAIEAPAPDVTQMRDIVRD